MSGRIYGTTQCLNCGKIFEKRTSRFGGKRNGKRSLKMLKCGEAKTEV